MRTRRLISATLLLLQALGLHHLALSTHDFDDTGAAYEHAALASDSHTDEGGHLCADVAVVERTESCPVVASWLTASNVVTPRSVLRAPESISAPGVSRSCGASPVAPLSVAPKSSPPSARLG